MTDQSESSILKRCDTIRFYQKSENTYTCRIALTSHDAVRLDFEDAKFFRMVQRKKAGDIPPSFPFLYALTL